MYRRHHPLPLTVEDQLCWFLARERIDWQGKGFVQSWAMEADRRDAYLMFYARSVGRVPDPVIDCNRWIARQPLVYEGNAWGGVLP